MLLGLQNVGFEFGARTIVRNATWHIQPQTRTALIGYNGAGKSTLLKLLTGAYTPAEGSIEKAGSTTIGFLHQDLLSFDTGDSILQVALGAFERVKFLENRLHEVGEKLEKEGTDALAIEYADILHELDVLDAYTIEPRTEEVLLGLGFKIDDLQKPYRQFSGGWRMRVLLAKLILTQPDVLLLDEPTNHLDLPSIEWLEKYLNTYPGAVVMVSHDRFFLDRMTNKTVELYQQSLHFYNGNYSFYEQEKQLRIDIQKKAYENQQDYIKQQERFVERFKAKASKATQAQSIIKRLDKLDRIEDVELERPNLKINFSVDKTPGKIISTLQNINKSYGNLQVIKNTSLEIERGDKIALIGANGKGKTTLLRIIADVEPFTGNITPGHNVQAGFYAQHQLEALHLENNILEEMETVQSGKTTLELRSLLGAFLFSGDDVDKKIKVLSGGEKARVALAKTIAAKTNFLLLDEPTNHLDLHSVELLGGALQQYGGTMVFVSHDRYFVSQVANKIWEIENGTVTEFKGSYAEYEVYKKEKAEKLKSITESNKAIDEDKKEPSKTEVKNIEPLKDSFKKPQKDKVEQKLKSEFEKTEKEIATLEAKKIVLEADLGNPELYKNIQEFQKLENQYSSLQQSLQALNEKYETLFTQLFGDV